MVMLSALHEAVFADPEPALKPSYRAPMKTYIRRYAQLLSCASPTQCSPETYNLSEDRRRELFAAHAQTFSTPGYLDKVFHGISTLLAAGVARGLIPPPPNSLKPWPLYRNVPKGTVRLIKERLNHHYFDPAVYRSPYRLESLPPALAAETQAYLDYCQKPIARGRSWKIVKRDVSCKHSRDVISRVAGYAVREHGMDPDRLTLAVLTDPALLDAFVWWKMERLGRSSTGVRNDLGTMLTIAKHWVKDERQIRAIQGLFGELPPPVAVRDKEALWLDLEELDIIGQSRHPANPRRLEGQPSDWTRLVLTYMDDPDAVRLPPSWLAGGGPNMKLVIMWIGLSLMIRFWVRRPLRSRQIREMKLSNLIEHRNGHYDILLSGEELKVGRRRGHINRWEAHWPHALERELHEWLTRWRPRITTPDCPYIFVNSHGRPFHASKMTEMIEDTTWTFTADRPGGNVAINPHQIRTLFGTQMGLAKLPIQTIAGLLGDNIQMVYERYVMNQQPRRISQWTKNLAKAIEDRVD